MKSSYLRIALVAVAILAVSFVLMRFFTAQKTELASRPPVVADRWVEVDTVVYQDHPVTIIAGGRVTSQSEVEVVAEASGRIEQGDVPLKKGQSFSAGDTLLTIYKDEVELGLKAAKSQFLNTIALLLPDLKIDFPDHYDAYLAFFNNIDLDGDLPPMPPVNDEKLKIFLASRNMLNEYFSIKRQEKALKRHSITAPFNGAFTQVSLQVGAYTNVGGRVARIIHIDALEVEVPVDVEDAPFIRIDQPVNLKSVDSHLEWQGTVVRISDFVDPSVQQRPVFVRVPLERQPKLYASDYLSAEFLKGSVAQTMSIPRSAVHNFDEVYIVQEGRLKIRQIERVRENPETLLFRGLEPGAFVVTQPLINVSDNIPVKRLGIDKKVKSGAADSLNITAQN